MYGVPSRWWKLCSLAISKTLIDNGPTTQHFLSIIDQDSRKESKPDCHSQSAKPKLSFRWPGTFDPTWLLSKHMPQTSYFNFESEYLRLACKLVKNLFFCCNSGICCLMYSTRLLVWCAVLQEVFIDFLEYFYNK